MFKMSLIKVFIWIFLLGNPLLLMAQNKGVDEILNERFMPFASWWEGVVFSQISIAGYSIPIVLILLVFGALLFTVYFSFVNIRRFPLALKVVRGKYDAIETMDDVEEQKEGETIHVLKKGNYGEVNHFQALATAVSGTVGLGNIAMVAVAISIGGPGATFWMIIAGLLGMSSKFVECTLAVKYRDIDKDGHVFGGPMYYLRKGFAELKIGIIGKVMAFVFAVLCIGASFGGGNAFQSNQAAAQIIERFGLHGDASGTILGLIFAIFVAIVIIGGIKRIAKVTEKLVPIMAIIYVGAALFIIFSHFSLIDDAIALILREAFTPQATIAGGVVGVLIQGFRRAAFSNEAGAGSAAIAHSAVDTKYPASEGLVSLLEPFIDTVIICTMTALVIVIYNMNGVFGYGDVINNEVLIYETGQRVGGVHITSMAFDEVIPGFSYVLAIAVVLFAFSTIISWSYYGLQSWKYIFGRSKTADLTYKILFVLFTVLGAAVTLDAVIRFSDAMLLAMVFPNMIGLLLLFPKVRVELKRYLTAIKERI